tara:strand:- start:4497 stop:4715 length:219 start_codon:yes stop_codon:yes gene_type:complete
MKLDTPFCTFNSAATIQPETGESIYLTAALGSFSGSFGTITLASNQSFMPAVPLKLDSTVSGTIGELFYYFD